MKAKDKVTGEIIDVHFNGFSPVSDYSSPLVPIYISDKQVVYKEQDLCFESDNETEKEIDWEQRRYEIAKDALCAVISANRSINFFEILDIADVLIAELKKKEE